MTRGPPRTHALLQIQHEVPFLSDMKEVFSAKVPYIFPMLYDDTTLATSFDRGEGLNYSAECIIVLPSTSSGLAFANWIRPMGSGRRPKASTVPCPSHGLCVLLWAHGVSLYSYSCKKGGCFLGRVIKSAKGRCRMIFACRRPLQSHSPM